MIAFQGCQCSDHHEGVPEAFATCGHGSSRDNVQVEKDSGRARTSLTCCLRPRIEQNHHDGHGKPPLLPLIHHLALALLSDAQVFKNRVAGARRYMRWDLLAIRCRSQGAWDMQPWAKLPRECASLMHSWYCSDEFAQRCRGRFFIYQQGISNSADARKSARERRVRACPSPG